LIVDFIFCHHWEENQCIDTSKKIKVISIRKKEHQHKKGIKGMAKAVQLGQNQPQQHCQN